MRVSGALQRIRGKLMRTTPKTKSSIRTLPLSETLTLVLSFYFIVGGVFKAIAATALRFPSWGWTLASGVASVALGVLLAVHWPATGSWFIGFAVGLDMIFYGWALLMFAVAIKKVSAAFA